jgi:hypothetical protein
MAQVVELLPRKYKALSSNPKTKFKKMFKEACPLFLGVISLSAGSNNLPASLLYSSTNTGL